MKKTAKIWIICATVLIIAGIVAFASVMTAYNWDFSRLNTENFETNTYEINEDFSDIKINTDTADIFFAVSSDNMCRVVCYEKENTKHFASVGDGTLTVSAADDKKWYEHIGFSFNSPKVTVYLPKTEYVSLVIKGSTGGIEIADEIKFDSADISLSTGDIRVNNISAGTLDFSASTGNIVISDVTCIGDMKASVTTGEVKMINVACLNLILSGSTGDISLKNVTATEKFSIERSTGDILFDSSDAAEIFVKTTTGNISGNLLSDKVFTAETSTGEINVPKTTSGGKCEIKSETGDIILEITK